MSAHEINIPEYDNFVHFFNEVDDDSLIYLAYYSPGVLYNLCMYLSIDLELDGQEKKKSTK